MLRYCAKFAEWLLGIIGTALIISQDKPYTTVLPVKEAFMVEKNMLRIQMVNAGIMTVSMA